VSIKTHADILTLCPREHERDGVRISYSRCGDLFATGAARPGRNVILRIGTGVNSLTYLLRGETERRVGSHDHNCGASRLTTKRYDMTISHSFLNSIEGSKKADAIAALPEWRKKNIIAQSIPGTRVGGLPFDEALAVSGADFEVREASLTATAGIKIESHKALVRIDNRVPVGIVGKDFGLVQHGQALEGLRDVCASGDVTLEAISVEEGGARIAATGLLGFSKIHQPGRDHADALAHFVRAKNAHDGSCSLTWGLFTLRLTCLNGQTAFTLIDGSRLRHTRLVQDRIGQARTVVPNLIKAAKEEVETFQQLADSKIAIEDFIKFSSELLTDVRGDANTDRKKVRREKDILELVDYFCDGAGNQGESKYDAYNAITDWLSVRRDQFEDSVKFANKFRASENGAASKTRQQALRLLQA
jgi:hypothetical protein